MYQATYGYFHYDKIMTALHINKGLHVYECIYTELPSSYALKIPIADGSTGFF